MNRRNFIKIAGSAGVILAASGAGVGAFVATRTPHAALQPWREASFQYADPMRNALSYAILAPNPHNRQPWQIDLKSDTEAELTVDLQRLLPATDPFGRQIVIGLGCFLELFALAARHNGHRAQITLFPEGEPSDQLDARPVAHLQLYEDPGISADHLFAYTLFRHTNRSVYDTERRITQESLHEIAAAAGSGVIANSIGDGPQLHNLRALTRDALRDEILNPEAFQESVDLMRIGRAEIEADPDGISLGGAFLEGLHLAGVLTREALANPESNAFQVGLNMADEQALSAMGFVWINTRGNGRREQVAAGRGYLRVALRVAGLGLAMQPMSQALQEYTAMQPYFEQAHAILTRDAGERIQMLARLGYAEAAQPAPRWILETRIKHG